MRRGTLPDSLWLLISCLTLPLPNARAQSSSILLNTPTFLSSSNFTSNPATFTLPNPSSSSLLSVSVALCSNSSTTPQFYVSNNSDSSSPGPSGGTDVYQLSIDDYGMADMNLVVQDDNTVTLAVWNAGSDDSIEIGASDQGAPLHQLLTDLPILGDTSANQAMLYSYPFDPPEIDSPTYPNYTLPDANTSSPTPPSTRSVSNFSLVFAPTSSKLTTLPQTGCALRNVSSEGRVLEQQLWLRDDEGWRSEWLVGFLTPETNYTAYTVEDGTKVSGPIYLLTKSATFPCPLVHSLPYCPSVSYAIPIPFPSFPAQVHDSTTLPSSLTDPLIGYLNNFTTSLLTFACGRDIYSPIQSCAGCQVAYRKWLCTVSFPRCGEFSSSSTTTTSTITSTGSGSATASTTPTPALVAQTAGISARNANLPAFNSNYTALLPCLEVCTATDRACPNILGFKCPSTSFNANSSYGVGFIDSGEVGEEWGGSTGVAQDRWGNVYCNGS